MHLGVKLVILTWRSMDVAVAAVTPHCALGPQHNKLNKSQHNTTLCNNAGEEERSPQYSSPVRTHSLLRTLQPSLLHRGETKRADGDGESGCVHLDLCFCVSVSVCMC